MADDSVVTERLRRPVGLTADDEDDSSPADTDESAELEIMPTDELKQILDPAAGKCQSDNVADVESETDHDDSVGSDPYDRI